jgi:hypothetical protein
MKKLLRKLDNFIDRLWRRTCATIFYYFDNKVEEEDIDWLNMQNNIIEDKKDYE